MVMTLSSTCVGTIAGTVSIVSGGTNRLFQNDGDLTITSTGLINEGGGNSSDFTLSATGILRIGSTAGISATGASGNIQLSGTITFSTGADYEYNGIAAQVTGTGLTQNTPANLTINNSTGVTLSAATTISGLLTMTSGTLNMANTNMSVGSLTGTSNITHSSGAAGNRTLTIGTDNTSPATYSGTISNGTATTTLLTKSGTGTLTLSGTNTYTGATTVTGGVLLLNSANALPGGIGNTGGLSNLVLNGGVIGLGTGNFQRGLGTGVTQVQFTGSGGFAAFGADRTVNLGGASATATWASGSFVPTASVLILGASTATNTVNFQNPIAFNSAVRTIQVDDGAAAIDATLSGLLSGTGTSGLTKTGAGLVQVTASNTYIGATSISAGTLQLGSAGGGTNTPLGTTGSGTTVNTGASLDLNGFTLGTSEGLTLNGTGISGSGALMNSGVAATFSGLVTLGSTGVSIVGGAGTINLSNAGTITGATFGLTLGGAQGGTLTSILGTTTGSLTKADAGTWTLNGNSTYTGATTINAGTLVLGANNRIADGSALTVNGVFDMAGFNETVASLAGAGTVTSSAAGSITLTTSSTTSTTFSGIIENGSGTVGLTRSGSGTLTLSGANTYTGTTTISGTGVIQLGASDVIPNTSPITLSGGTLRTGSGVGFTESIGVLTLSATSTIALGTGVHTLTISNSSGATWGAFTLNISSWTGFGGTSGTASAGKIMVGVGGLISGQLSKITFTGFTAGAVITSSGECVPNANYFYSQTSGIPTTLSNWNSNRAGGGSSPANFTTAGNVYVIQGIGNGGTTPHTMTTTAAWTVSGTGTAVVVENGATLTAAATFPITLATATSFSIENGGTYKHQNTTSFASSIFQGTEIFGESSTVELNNSNTTGPTGVAFGNLIVNFTADPGGNVNLSGGITTIKGNLSVQSTLAREFRLTRNTTFSLDIAGNLSVTNGTLNLSSGSGVVTVNLAGNLTHTGGTINETGSGSGTFVFLGTGTQIYTSGGTLSNSISHTINSGSTVDFGTSIISNGATGTFTLNSGGTIITANSAGLTSSGAIGTIRSTGTRTYSSAANYEFQGSNTGAFTLSTPNTITGTLTFNRAGGITIDQNFTATTLALTSGAVTTNLLSITIPAGGSFTGGSSTAYVNGILNRVYSSASSLVFPIGKGNNYRPVTFEYTALTGTSTVTIQQNEAALTGTLPASTNLNNGRTWDISQSGGSAFSYKVTLDGSGDVVSGTVVMLAKESGIISSNAVTTPNYTNSTDLTSLTGIVNFTLGSTCTITADAGSDQTGFSTCGSTTVVLDAVTPAFGSGQWSIISGFGGSFSGGLGNPANSNQINSNFNGTTGSTYVLQWSISNGACSASDQMTVTFNPNPTVADAGLDQLDAATCGLTSVNLSANTPSVGSGSWSIVSGVGGSFSNSFSETSTFNGVSGNSYTLRWTIASSPCTSSTDDVDITFNSEPTTSDAGVDQNFCLGTSTTLAANSPIIGIGEWSISAGPSSNLSQFSNIADPTATFTPDGGLGPYDLVWTITNTPCVSSSTVTLTTISGPWIGGVSTDWTNPANWCGGVPDAFTDVTIPNGATFYPVITTGSQVAASITIESAASLTVDGGDLIGGPVENDGTFIIGVGGTVDMISDQIIGSGDVFIDGTFLTSKAAGFSGTSNTAIKNTIGSLLLGTTSTIDYTSSGGQTISDANYANILNSGNGDRTLSTAGTIGISGSFNPGTGDYTISNSTVEFNGTTPQNIPALAPDSKYNNLIINNGTGVSMVADLNLEDALTLTNGAFTTTGFNFTLLSSATQTARIAPITGGSIVGNVTMQRFVPGGNAGWATIGMPVGGRTLADWDDDIITTGFNGSSTGSGTFVNIYSYDETIAGNADDAAAYVPATDITNSVDPTKGYFVFIADNATTVSDKVLDVTGPPLTGAQNLNVTYTNNVNSDEDGWNLINNPYCSSIDWTSLDWTKTNMDDAIYIYDADNLQYTGYVNGATFNGGNEIIGSSQAFLVHANAAAPSLIAAETVKDATSPTFYKSSSTSVATGFLRLQLDGLGGTFKDETIIRTKAGATFNFDPAYDAYKLLSFDFGAPNISTRLNGRAYVVNSIDELTSNLDLDVKVIVNTPGSYSINFKGLNNFANVNCLTFEDKLLGTFVDLHIDSSYTFNSAIDTAAAYNRFVLHFGLDALTASILPSATSISLPGNGTVNFTNTSTGASAFTWNFGDGSPAETVMNPSHTFTAAGVYTVSLTASNTAGCSGPQTTTVLITVDDVTSVDNQNAAEQISISKDVQGLFANYNFKNSTQVQVNIYNALGELVSNEQQIKVQNKGRFAIQTKTLAKGIYTIEMLFNGTRMSKKMDF